MNLPDPRALAVQSVRNPDGAAQVLMALDVPRNVLWSALLLMATLQSVLFALSVMMLPVSAPPMPTLALIYGSPLSFFAMTVVLQILSVYSIYGVGRLFGGQGTIENVMTAMVWFQALQVVAKSAALVIGTLFPLLEILIVMFATVVGIYMFVHFINQAHGFGSLMRTVMALIAASVVVLVGLSLLLTMIVVPYLGSSSYV